LSSGWINFTRNWDARTFDLEDLEKAEWGGSLICVTFEWILRDKPTTVGTIAAQGSGVVVHSTRQSNNRRIIDED
jgi:hypothetical protein